MRCAASSIDTSKLKMDIAIDLSPFSRLALLSRSRLAVPRVAGPCSRKLKSTSLGSWRHDKTTPRSSSTPRLVLPFLSPSSLHRRRLLPLLARRALFCRASLTNLFKPRQQRRFGGISGLGSAVARATRSYAVSSRMYVELPLSLCEVLKSVVITGTSSEPVAGAHPVARGRTEAHGLEKTFLVDALAVVLDLHQN